MKLTNLLLAGAAVAVFAISASAVVNANTVVAGQTVRAVAPQPIRATPGPVKETSFAYGAAGRVTVYRVTPEPERFVVFVSGDGGWNQGVVDMARQLAHMNATVVGVDVGHYLRVSQSGKGTTLYPAGDLSGLAQAVQRSLGFKSYHRPVLVGYSSGATLVYGALVQSPANIFQGAIGLGFCPDLQTVKPLAAGDGGLAYSSDAKLGFVYRPAKSLTAPFIALQGGQDRTCLPGPTHDFIAQTPRASVVDLPKVGHGFSAPGDWAPQFARAFDSLFPFSGRVLSNELRPDRLASLPLVEVPAAGDGDTMAVFYSGDGGWAGIDRGLADGFVQAGIPVVGYDSLRYFWTRRTPEEAASDLTAVLQTYMATWHKSQVVLAGYSFGADALPAIVAHLSPEMRSHVRFVALLGADKEGELEFQPGDWFNQNSPSAYALAPVLAELKGLPVLCLYGDQETDSACPAFAPGLVRPVRLSGGHHFDGDYASVGRAILKAGGI